MLHTSGKTSILLLGGPLVVDSQYIFGGNIYILPMERLYMEAQDGLKTIAPPLFLNIFFYFLLV